MELIPSAHWVDAFLAFSHDSSLQSFPQYLSPNVMRGQVVVLTKMHLAGVPALQLYPNKGPLPVRNVGLLVCTLGWKSTSDPIS